MALCTFANVDNAALSEDNNNPPSTHPTTNVNINDKEIMSIFLA